MLPELRGGGAADIGFNQRHHTKRQATQHGCLPSLLGDGDKGIEIAYGKEKNILQWAD